MVLAGVYLPLRKFVAEVCTFETIFRGQQRRAQGGSLESSKREHIFGDAQAVLADVFGNILYTANTAQATIEQKNVFEYYELEEILKNNVFDRKPRMKRIREEFAKDPGKVTEKCLPAHSWHQANS